MTVPSFGYLEPAKAPSDKAPSPDTPFRVAILGDFSGRASRGEGEGRDADALATVKPIAVSRDNLEEVMARLKVRLRLPLPDGEEVALPFQSLDDFDPDEVVGRVDKFDDLDDDDEKSTLLKTLLHHPHFQDLESLWRGLAWFLKRVHQTGSGIEVALFDIGFDELTADLDAGDDLANTGLYRSLLSPIVESGKAQPWALLLGHYTFELSAERIGTLGKLARFAGVAAAPFLAAAPPGVLAKDFALTEDAAEAWDALRRLPEAALVGLVAPRFLMRQPFGENTKTIDKFAFEEVESRKSQAGYLWANPAFGVAILLGLSFHKESWGFKTGGVLDLDELPLHVWRDEDGDEQMTLAEAWLDRKAVERLVKLGFMPFLSVRGKNALQLFKFVSVAQPPKGQQAVDLVGRWGQKGSLKVPRSVGRPNASVQLMSGAAPPAPSPPVAQEKHGADEKDKTDENPQTAEPPPEAEAPAAPADDVMDPELTALMKSLEQPAAPVANEPEASAAVEPESSATAQTAAPADEEMDPELAALMKSLEGGDAPAANDPTATEPEASATEQSAAPADEDMDPELAALMKSLEGGDAPAANDSAATEPEASATEQTTAPADEEMDPELAALMKSLEGGDEAPPADEPEAAAEPEASATEQTTAPADEEMDPELAALMKSLEGGDEAPPADEPEAAAEPEASATDESAAPPADLDPELTALLKSLENGDEAAAEVPPEADASSPPNSDDSDEELQKDFAFLGGKAALDELGWPTFAPAFLANVELMYQLLRQRIKNNAVEKEIADLVRKCGGYDTLVDDGIRPGMPFNALLARLRDVHKILAADKLLEDDEAKAMANEYGATLKKATSPKAKSELLQQVREYDQWARDARHVDLAAALDGCPFKERRQAMLEHQLAALGGDEAFAAALAAHPRDLTAKAALDKKAAVLRGLKEYTKLGGDDAFQEKVGGDPAAAALLTKLEQLKAVVAAERSLPVTV